MLNIRRLLRRSWLYLRMGYGTYLVFFIGAINFLTITYYLAISGIPFLSFLHFWLYCLIMIPIGCSVAVLLGYVHFKRTGFFQAEMDINIESNPYYYIVPPGYNRDVLIPAGLLTLQLLKRIAEREQMLSVEEKELIEELEKKYKVLWKGGRVNG